MSSSSSIINPKENSSQMINVYGKRGTGKTTYFSKFEHVKFDHDILKSKEKTIDFLDMMNYSKFPLVLDDYELVENLPGIKELRKLKNVAFYVISTQKVFDPSFEFTGVTLEEFAKSHKNVSIETIKDLFKKANGNLTSVKMDIETFKSERDIFLNSKEYAMEVINAETPSKFIDRHLTEHGNTLGIIHENYPDYSDDFEKISQSLSDADLIDMKIYADVSWDLMNYFNVSACLIPSLYMDKAGALDKSKLLYSLRPGSVWTKTSNMLMKKNRLKRLGRRRDEIQLWVEKANKGEELDPKFDSYDLDSINQLSFNKIKPRLLSSLKKKCQTKNNTTKDT